MDEEMRPIRPEDIIYDQPPPVKQRGKKASPSVFDAPTPPLRITPGEPPIKQPGAEMPVPEPQGPGHTEPEPVNPFDVPEPRNLSPKTETSAPPDFQREQAPLAATVEEIPSREALEDQFGRHIEALQKSAEQRFLLYQETITAREKALMAAAEKAQTEIAKTGFDALREQGMAAMKKFAERLGLLKQEAQTERPDAHAEALRSAEETFRSYRAEIVRRLQDVSSLIKKDHAWTYGSQIRFADALVSDEAVRKDFEQQLLMRPGAASNPEISRQIEVLSSDEETRRKAALDTLNSVDVWIDKQVVQQFLVPELLRNTSPSDLHEALRDGFENPRFLLDALREGVDFKARLERSVVPSLRSGWQALRDESRVPDRFRALAKTAANQLQNRFFSEGADSLDDLVSQWSASPEDAGAWEEVRAMLEPLGAEARREALAERERTSAINSAALEAMESVLSDPQEQGRHERLQAKKELFELFASPQATFELSPMTGDRMTSNAPVFAEVVQGEKRVKALVKFEFSERFTRKNVTPGSGPWREVIGFQHSVEAGFDNAPVSVAREIEGFGRVVVMELVDQAQPCTRSSDWYKGSDDGWNPDLAAIALEDIVMFRNDGQPRNMMVTDKGSLKRIDFGSDFSDETAMSSVAGTIMADEGREIAKRDIWKLKEYRQSPRFERFVQTLRTLPEDMSGYIDRYTQRLDEMISKADRGETVAYGDYMKVAYKDSAFYTNDYKTYRSERKTTAA